MEGKELGHEYALPDVFADGLTKREWFAGMALQGLLANVGGNPPVVPKDAAAKKAVSCWGPFFAELSVGYADALLERLAQEDSDA